MKNRGKESVFVWDDFAAERMAPYFAEESSVVALAERLGYVVRRLPGDGGLEPDGYYAFLDRGAKTLAVAHLDTVYASTPPTVRGLRLYSGGVDNRFGAYVVMALLAEKGIEADVLLTTNEEMCMSSARFFDPPREYNWTFSFDRMGGDVALYEYLENGGEFTSALEAAGLSGMSRGTYSDVADLSFLGCKGVNVGIGYCQNPHSPDAYVRLDVAAYQLNRFADFWFANSGRRFEHDRAEIFSFQEMLARAEFDVVK